MSDPDKHFFWRAACMIALILLAAQLNYQQRRIRRLADNQEVILEAVEVIQSSLITTMRAITNLRHGVVAEETMPQIEAIMLTNSVWIDLDPMVVTDKWVWLPSYPVTNKQPNHE